jgi:hypothetical protein
MVKALTEAPNSDTIVFQFDGRRTPNARTAGIPEETKHSVLLDNVPFVRGLSDRGYEIDKILYDEVHSDRTYVRMQRRPAAKP